MPDSKNTYAHAASAYGNVAAETDTRTLQGTVLLKAAQMLEDMSARIKGGEKVSLDEMAGVLDHNSKLWQLFVDTVKDPEHLMPQDVRENILSLALFIFKRTNEILIEVKPEKFHALVSINRNIAAGLMKKPARGAAAPTPMEAPSPSPAADSRVI